MTGDKRGSGSRELKIGRRALALMLVVGIALIGLWAITRGDDSQLDKSMKSSDTITPGASSTAQSEPERHQTDASTTPPTSSSGNATESRATAPTKGTRPAAPPSLDRKALRKKSQRDAALAEKTQDRAAAVELTEVSKPERGIAVHLDDIEAVEGKARGVGEIEGPAIRFTVIVANRTGEPLDAERATVNVTYGEAKLPAVRLSGPGVTSLPSTIKTGTNAQATYVFQVPPKHRKDVSILFNYDAQSPIVVFDGSAPSS